MLHVKKDVRAVIAKGASTFQAIGKMAERSKALGSGVSDLACSSEHS